jgi:putative membrane protein
VPPAHRSLPEEESADYRYTLANERTFLAWVRTCLAMLAGAVGLAQLGWHVGPRWVRLAAALVLGLGGLSAAISGLVRWRRVDAAIRSGQPLSRHAAPWLVGLTMVILALALLSLIVAEFYASWDLTRTTGEKACPWVAGQPVPAGQGSRRLRDGLSRVDSMNDSAPNKTPSPAKKKTKNTMEESMS